MAKPVGRYMKGSRYKITMMADSTHQWRLLELRPRKKGRGGHHFVCIAIGTGKENADKLRDLLP